jgi:hypothetical protein
MARNGSGTYSLYVPGNPVVTGTTISSTWANNTLNDIATALTNSIAKDGQTTPTANLPMGTFKLTGLGAGSAATDSANLGQIQAGVASYLTAVAGADTITASATPTLTAYTAGNTFRFIAAGANTGAVTLNIDGLGAKAVTKNGTSPLITGDILSGAALEVIYDGTQFQLVSTSATAPFTDTRALVKGSVDATKLIRVEADLITTATTRVWTAQDKDITVAGLADTGQRLWSVSASCAANALTAIIISGDNYGFRNTAPGNGSSTNIGLAANVSVVVPNTATLGTVNNQSARLAILAINNAGTIEAAIVNTAGTLVLDETGTINTTAISAAATSASVVYSTTARTGVTYRVAGYIEIVEATAGTWASQPTNVQPAGGQSLAVKGFNLVTAAPQATTSGTSIDFSGIPAWAKQIHITLSGVSVSSTSNILIQIGAGSTPETTGYLGASSLCSGTTTTNANFTTGFGVNASGAANVYHGRVTLTLVDFTTGRWAASGVLSASNTAATILVSGSKTITGTLGIVRITTSGADTFDAGVANVLWD